MQFQSLPFQPIAFLTFCNFEQFWLIDPISYSIIVGGFHFHTF